jgi:hypothetical protein
LGLTLEWEGYVLRWVMVLRQNLMAAANDLRPKVPLLEKPLHTLDLCVAISISNVFTASRSLHGMDFWGYDSACS